jgi:hypothetical protein
LVEREDVLHNRVRLKTKKWKCRANTGQTLIKT